MSGFLKIAIPFLIIIFIIPTLFVPGRLESQSSSITIGEYTYGDDQHQIGDVGYNPLTDYNEYYEVRESTDWDWKIEEASRIAENNFHPIPDFPELEELRKISSFTDFGHNIYAILMFPVHLCQWIIQFISFLFGDVGGLIGIVKVFLFN